MGLSRRQFTKEFKLAAIQRLEMGVSVAEVARASRACVGPPQVFVACHPESRSDRDEGSAVTWA